MALIEVGLSPVCGEGRREGMDIPTPSLPPVDLPMAMGDNPVPVAVAAQQWQGLGVVGTTLRPPLIPPPSPPFLLVDLAITWRPFWREQCVRVEGRRAPLPPHPC